MRIPFFAQIRFVLTSAVACPAVLATAVLASATASEPWRLTDHPATVEPTILAVAQARRRIAVTSPADGVLARLDLQPGAVVGADGQVGALADAGVCLAIAAAEADRAASESARRTAERSRDLARLEADFRTSETTRIGQDVKAGVKPKEMLGEADYQARKAAASLALAEAQVGEAAAGVVRAQARVEAERAALDRLHLVAPPGWRCVERLHEPGLAVTAGQPLLMVAEPVPVAEVSLTVPELAALAQAEIQAGQPLHPVRMAGHLVLPGTDPVRRRVQLILAPATMSATAPAHAGSATGGNAIADGDPVVVRLRLPDPAGAVLVPAAWLVDRGRGPELSLDGGRTVSVAVLRRVADGQAAILVPGLAAGDAAQAPP